MRYVSRDAVLTGCKLLEMMLVSEADLLCCVAVAMHMCYDDRACIVHIRNTGQAQVAHIVHSSRLAAGTAN